MSTLVFNLIGECIDSSILSSLVCCFIAIQNTFFHLYLYFLKIVYASGRIRTHRAIKPHLFSRQFAYNQFAYTGKTPATKNRI